MQKKQDPEKQSHKHAVTQVYARTMSHARQLEELQAAAAPEDLIAAERRHRQLKVLETAARALAGLSADDDVDRVDRMFRIQQGAEERNEDGVLERRLFGMIEDFGRGPNGGRRLWEQLGYFGHAEKITAAQIEAILSEHRKSTSRVVSAILIQIGDAEEDAERLRRRVDATYRRWRERNPL